MHLLSAGLENRKKQGTPAQEQESDIKLNLTDKRIILMRISFTAYKLLNLCMQNSSCFCVRGRSCTDVFFLTFSEPFSGRAELWRTSGKNRNRWGDNRLRCNSPGGLYRTVLRRQ